MTDEGNYSSLLLLCILKGRFLYLSFSQARKKLRLGRTVLGISNPSFLSGLNQLVMRSQENDHKKQAISSGQSICGHSCKSWWVVVGVGLVAATQKTKNKVAMGNAPMKYCGPKCA